MFVPVRAREKGLKSGGVDGRSPLVVDDPRRLRCEKDAPGSAWWVEVIGEGRATLPVWGIYNIYIFVYYNYYYLTPS